MTGPWAHPESGRTNEAWRFILKTSHRELPVCINAIKRNNKSSCKTAALNKYDLQGLQIGCQPPKTKLQLYDQKGWFYGNFCIKQLGSFLKEWHSTDGVKVEEKQTGNENVGCCIWLFSIPLSLPTIYWFFLLIFFIFLFIEKSRTTWNWGIGIKTQQTGFKLAFSQAQKSNSGNIFVAMEESHDLYIS